MAGIARRVLTGFFILQFISIPLSICVLADGGVFSEYGELVYLDQSSQSAIIDHSNGIQSMLISINFEWQESDAVAWIFPIPSDPGMTQTSIVDGAPNFYGVDIVEKARSELADSIVTYAISYATSSLAPWPATMILTRVLIPGSGITEGRSLGLEDGGQGEVSTVTVHSHIEKYGLAVEVISATEGEGIYYYLTQEGLDISENIVPQLDDYVEKDYSFVVTWVEYSTDITRELGVVVEFPTIEMFYPLMLTSVYGDDVIPMQIIVTQHVDTKLYPEIESHTSIRFFRRGNVELDWDRDYDQETHRFVDRIEDNWRAEFTVIELTAPSKELKDDLWMTSGTPDELRSAESVENLLGMPTSILTLTLIGLAASVLSQLTAGGLYLGRKRENLPYYLILGLANIIGILFLIYVGSLLRERMGLDWTRFVKFLGLSFVAFTMFSLVFFIPFSLVFL
jgi:hypothetical protein